MTPSQFRAAKALLDWSFEDLEERTGLSRMALQNIAGGRAKPRDKTLEKLLNTFEKNGVEIIDGGARWAQNIVKIYEGEDCYLRLLDDAIYEKAEEIVFNGADERRSPASVVDKFKTMRKSGMKMRSLIKHGDTHIMGRPEEYRWMPDNMFVDGDVKVMFGDSVAYLMSWLGVPRVIKITDAKIAQENLRMFNYVWENVEGPKKSTSGASYD